MAGSGLQPVSGRGQDRTRSRGEHAFVGRAPSRSDGRHIPPKGSHLVRYYGWYSNKSRGMRKKATAEASAEPSSESEDSASAAASRCSQSWAMLIKRVYEVNPLCCPECGGQMTVVSFIEPPQADVIEEILIGHRRAADPSCACVPVGGLCQARSRERATRSGSSGSFGPRARAPPIWTARSIHRTRPS